MRAAFLLGAGERGGSERVLEHLVSQLPAFEVRPTVVATVSGQVPDDLRSSGVDVVLGPPMPRTRDLRSLRSAASVLGDVVDRTEADVLVGVGEKMSLFSCLAARRSRSPVVAWLHDAPLRSLGASALQGALSALRPAAAVVPAAWMQAGFRRLGLRTVVVPNAVAVDQPPTADPRSLVGWEDDTAIVAFFGRLQRWKGPDVFIEAARRVATEHQRARFLVVGGALYGWEEDFARGLDQLVRDLGLADVVHLAGHRADARSLMAGCDVVVHCSRRREPFGMVVAEAMALGRPVVATRTGGPEAQIDHGVTGVLVPPDDPGACAEAVALLLTDPDRRETIGRAAKLHARSAFGPERLASSFAQLVRQVASGPRSES